MIDVKSPASAEQPQSDLQSSKVSQDDDDDSESGHELPNKSFSSLTQEEMDFLMSDHYDTHLSAASDASNGYTAPMFPAMAGPGYKEPGRGITDDLRHAESTHPKRKASADSLSPDPKRSKIGIQQS